ncbi:hydrogenase/urease maturation nickel metallochaperone HypA [Pseudarthrobacter sp. AL07]|uniref:hydrogenase/urease maturation nickel metallochaperone HypA n=1 Tax=unclassified Pseudarthrobacter TaxID=2647000 RepID=UPI00249C3881|nr:MULTISPECIES: hydrogenase/urease maturation nickel metallochaperone HypA [unclassified Pseudarthrobacter]MDI3194187.1 hydrogenase/urease maturation nickel metallochaperone HypA [Pseudarthrobacter sp. AL20]MDI3208253.1 hydrogenase/urease maturation nickel metallochaperone HypA [Pseudarthrobacter sp. AL07]
MHELSIRQSLIDAVLDRTGGQAVTGVSLRIGSLSGVLPDALRLCFDVASAGTTLAGARLRIEEPQAHEHSREPGHTRTPDGHAHTPELIPLEQNLLAKNGLLAERNRGWLAGRNVRALNTMNSPCFGKTTLPVLRLTELVDRLQAGFIEGDQETSLDADRIRKAGRPVVQINTGAGAG